MPLNVGYTVCPAFNRATLDKVKRAIRHIRKWCPVPLILENPPTYFVTPGTEMTQPEFFHALIDGTDCGLLLDLAHFAITCENLGVDTAAWLEAFPLENVVELHLSGMAQQSGITWDNHALPCSDQVWQLFTQALRRCTPQAVTIEYNWSPNFPLNVVEQDLRQVRRLLKEAA
jgi:uncharacterized protein (UPF0276 family)